MILLQPRPLPHRGSPPAAGCSGELGGGRDIVTLMVFGCVILGRWLPLSEFLGLAASLLDCECPIRPGCPYCCHYLLPRSPDFPPLML